MFCSCKSSLNQNSNIDFRTKQKTPFFFGIFITGGFDRFSSSLGLNENTPAIILGDFNARSIDWGDHVGNIQGTTIQNITTAIGLERISPSNGVATFHTGRGHSIIDHVFATQSVASMDLTVSILDRESIGGSNHRPVIASLEWDRQAILVENHAPKSWNRWRLKQPQVIAMFQERLAKTFSIF